MGFPVALALKWAAKTLPTVIEHLKKIDLDRTSAIEVENWIGDSNILLRKKGDYFDCGGFDDTPSSAVEGGQKDAWGVTKKPGAYGVCGAIQYEVSGVDDFTIVYVFYNPQTGSNRAYATWTKHDAEYVFTHWEDNGFEYKGSDTQHDLHISSSSGSGNHNQITFGIAPVKA